MMPSSQSEPEKRPREDEAAYVIDVQITVLGPRPAIYNKAAPELTPVTQTIVDLAAATLKAHGYEVAHRGYGSMRDPEADPPRADESRVGRLRPGAISRTAQRGPGRR